MQPCTYPRGSHSANGYNYYVLLPGFDKQFKEYTFKEEEEECNNSPSPFSLHRKKPKDYGEDACSLQFWLQNLLVYDPLFQPLAEEGRSYFYDWQSLYFSHNNSRLFYFDIYQRMMEDLMEYTADYLHPAYRYDDIPWLYETTWEHSYFCWYLKTGWEYIDKNTQLKVPINYSSNY